MISLIPSNDNEVRSVKIQLASGNVVGRPLCLLYPLEVGNYRQETEIENNTNEENSEKRPTRRAAEKGKQKIKELYKD